MRKESNRLKKELAKLEIGQFNLLSLGTEKKKRTVIWA